MASPAIAEPSASANAAPATTTSAGLKHLVIDSGAVIHGGAAGLVHSAEHFWTVPAVVAEIRDKKARHLLDTLPYELKLREPSEEALSFAISFARETGDLRSLSRVDLSVIALTYDLEKQETGAAHIKAKPTKPGAQQPSSAPAPQQQQQQQQPRGSAAVTAAVAPPSLSAPPTQHAPTTSQPQLLEGKGTGSEGSSSSGSSTGTDGEEDEEEGSGPDEEHMADEDYGSSDDGDADAFDLRDDDFPALGAVSLQEGDDQETIAENTSGGSSVPAAVKGGERPAPTAWAATALAHRDEPLRHTQRPQTVIIANNSVAAAADAQQQQAAEVAEDALSKAVAQRPQNALSSRILNATSSTGVTSVDAAEDDGIGWVSPANFTELKSTGLMLGSRAASSKSKGTKARRRAREDAKALAQCRAGCVTTDFAMQNVLLQMGLPLVSVGGMAVRRVKQWVLRCAACFKTTTDMEKLFCPVCGNNTLEKVSCSVDAATGQTKLHLNPKRKPNLRGTKYSIPKPGTSGRFNGDLLLREDQLMSGIWAQKAKRTVKSQGCMFGEHIMDGVGLSMGKQSSDVVVGYGRKNPNSQRGRERRGKGGSKR